MKIFQDLLHRTILKIYLLVFIVLIPISGFSQMRIFERISSNDIRNDETIYQSDTRIKINLNGNWKISFDEEKYNDVKIPFAVDYKNTIYLKKQFEVSDSILKNCNFVFIAEGINYDSEVKINDAIVSRNSGGGKFIFTDIQEGLLKNTNNISIKIDNELDNKRTIPLANQVNYAKTYSGVTGNIYIFAIPKIYISEVINNIKFETDNNIRISSQIQINSFDIEYLLKESDVVIVKSEVIKKSTGDKVFESSSQKINVKSYQNYKVSSEISAKNFESWSPENPNLYYIKTILTSQDNTIDDYIVESGFANTKFQNNEFFLNGKKVTIKGINYFEDQPNFASALEYAETEKDLLKIKDIGFNCVRVPGKSAHPFIVMICQRIGLMLMQEIPFNEVPDNLISTEKYYRNGIEYLENIIKRDKNSPAIIFWGIGNDFDVMNKYSEKYAKDIKEVCTQLDSRNLYYTTKNIQNDSIKNIISIKGLNLTHDNYIKYKDEIAKNKNINFISSFGVEIENENRNGFGDMKSAEFQAKTLTDFIKTFGNLPGYFISSFADYNAQSPILNNFDVNPYLRTNGIFTIHRELKYSAGIIKRVLNNQNFQKIPEGTETAKSKINNNFLVIIGIVGLFVLILANGKLKYFKENIIKSIISPKNFLYMVKQESGSLLYHNILLIIMISVSLGLYLSSLISIYFTDSDFDLLLSKVFANDGMKLFLVNIFESSILTFLFISIFLLGFLWFLILIVQSLNFFTRKSTKFKITFSIVTYSFVPFLVFLIFGMILSKLSTVSTFYLNLSIFLGIILFLYAFFKIISSIRQVYEFHFLKTYLIGFATFAILFLIFYYYLFVMKSISDYINLIKSFS